LPDIKNTVIINGKISVQIWNVANPNKKLTNSSNNKNNNNNNNNSMKNQSYH
jgi:hypothetical protein